MGDLRLLTISFCLLGDLLASDGLKEEMGMEVQDSRGREKYAAQRAGTNRTFALFGAQLHPSPPAPP